MLEKEEWEQLLRSTLSVALAPIKSDIKDIKQKLGEHDARLERIEQKLDEHDARLERIEQKLDEHTEILNEHTKTLNEHTEILNEHTKILDEHTKTLDEHTEILNEHTKTLDEHTKTLDEHTEILNEHDKILMNYAVQFKSIRKDLHQIHLQIEQEVLPAIRVIAEGHQVLREDLNKRLDIAIKDRENREKMDLRVTKLEYEVKQIKKKIALA